MRGYGIPEIDFACESHMDDIARGLGMTDALRKKNQMQLGYKTRLPELPAIPAVLKSAYKRAGFYSLG